MIFLSPQTSDLIADRNELLAEALRPYELPFSIAEEYPIVLDAACSEFSHVLLENDEIVAHANLWPRSLHHRSTDTTLLVGLVGNVATSKKWRGKGYMSKLIGHLAEQAVRQKMMALILWSDLQSFYEKLGFKTLGKEYRFTFTRKDLRKSIKVCPSRLQGIIADDIKPDDRKQMLQLRYPVPCTLCRSEEEYAKLLKIPALQVFVSKSSPMDSFFIMGKGYDMAGVIHEWGCANQNHLLSGVLNIMEITGLEEIILLCPGGINKTWLDYLTRFSRKREVHPMALYCPLVEDKAVHKLLHESFIWGVDSI
jgi:N-acetylglutamate synthase-like GNAT family acetyltransferase